MTTTTTTTITTRTMTVNATKAKTTRTLVCFSFAAYAKTLIEHLKYSLNIPVLPGLKEHEFASIESSFSFKFPPDLRSILQYGLPVGPHFPNWRSSSPQQLHILLNLPRLNLSKNISHNEFWVVDGSWGDRPLEDDEALLAAHKLLSEAPVLVPVYRNCYIPSSPHLAGNPVFYIDDKEVKVLSFDVARFFKETEFLNYGLGNINNNKNGGGGGVVGPALDVPAWAATEARRVEFWTEVAEKGRRIEVARGHDTRGWWCDIGHEDSLIGSCLEHVFWTLTDGGWKEEEVRDMMMMDAGDPTPPPHQNDSQYDATWHVRVLSLSLVLLRAGWSMDDVMDSLHLEGRDGAYWELQVGPTS